MEDRDAESDAAWEKARGTLFRPVPPPTRAETEAFVRRLMESLPEERIHWAGRWLMPSLAFSAAALSLSLFLPVSEADADDALILAASPAVSAWAAAPSGVGDLLGYDLEDR